MPAIKRPRRGSKAFYPKKRARRIYPRIKTYPEIKEAKPLSFAGYKAGMSHAMMIDTNPHSMTKGQQISRSVTILECPAISVFGFRLYHNSVSSFDVISDKLDKNLSRKLKISKKPKSIEDQLKGINKFDYLNLLCHTNPTFKKKPEIFEISLGGNHHEQLEYAKKVLGKNIKVSEIFRDGDFVDVIAVTKGKGFQGPVKRFGIKILRPKAQQMQRHTGALGQTEPGKIRHTVPAAGQLGFQTRTELNKRILKITDGKELNPAGGFINFGFVEGDCLLIEGSVPGPKKRLIRLRFPVRPPKSKHPVDLKSISTHSQQGV